MHATHVIARACARMMDGTVDMMDRYCQYRCHLDAEIASYRELWYTMIIKFQV